MRRALSARTSSFPQNAAFFVAIIATTLALGGALAHAYEMLNKIALSRDHYFIVQRTYDGWNQLAYVLGVQFIGILAVIALHRNQPAVIRLGLVALTGLIAAQAAFWTWTYPANVATNQWTMSPDNWQALRAQWEYSHLAGAGLQLLAMMALVLALLRRVQ